MADPFRTDAVNRASTLSYGEATGITQTVRNYAASMGLAILGTILVTVMRNRVTASLISLGVPSGRASAEASGLSQSRGGSGECQLDSALRPARLRLRHPDRALRHGGGYGRGGDRGTVRPASRGAAGRRRSRDGPRRRALARCCER